MKDVKLQDQPASGTGSYPPFLAGVHRNKRRTAIYPPFNMPYFSMASYVYSEQVGM